MCGEDVVGSAHVLADAEYDARLIEGYDIGAIRDAYESLYDRPSDAALTLERLTLALDGALHPARFEMDMDDVVAHVESTMLATSTEFGLFDSDGASSVVIGLSGGVDSTSLLLGLSAIADQIGGLHIVSATFQDFDTGSPTHSRASQIAASCGVEHHLIAAELAQEVFKLRVPVSDALTMLMKTDSAHQVMYIDHHTTRRSLEVFAASVGASTIALGLHVTDLMAGLLNGMFTGYDVASIPARQIGSVRYVYPLAFLQKRELHLYFRALMGEFATHAHPNQWELHPQDRNFYYYLADVLQEQWPGLEAMLFTAHQWRTRRATAIVEEQCACCGSTLLHQPFTPVRSDLCDVCEIFAKHDLLDGVAL
jgi:tRNA(Ile)-lysidine synthase TilS/MesJ